MKLNVYSFKDNALGCWTNPFFNDVPVENVAVGVTRSIVSAEKPSSYKHKVLYRIGIFDDEKGELVTNCKDLVLDCDEVLARLNGKDSEAVA